MWVGREVGGEGFVWEGGAGDDGVVDVAGADLTVLGCGGDEEVEVAMTGAVRVAAVVNELGIEGVALSAAKEEVV